MSSIAYVNISKEWPDSNKIKQTTSPWEPGFLELIEIESTQRMYPTSSIKEFGFFFFLYFRIVYLRTHIYKCYFQSIAIIITFNSCSLAVLDLRLCNVMS